MELQCYTYDAEIKYICKALTLTAGFTIDKGTAPHLHHSYSVIHIHSMYTFSFSFKHRMLEHQTKLIVVYSTVSLANHFFFGQKK